MNREQKQAWVAVVIMLLSFAIALTVLIINKIFGVPGAYLAGIIPFCGMFLAWLFGLFVPKDKGKVIRDERDLMIKKNAAHAGFIGAFLYTCAACMITFCVLGPNGTISVKWLPMLWMGAGLAHGFLYSLTIIVDYGWGSKGE